MDGIVGQQNVAGKLGGKKEPQIFTEEKELLAAFRANEGLEKLKFNDGNGVRDVIRKKPGDHIFMTEKKRMLINQEYVAVFPK